MSSSKAYGDETPIAALATTPGNSALSLIRCSGKGTLELAASVFSAPQKLKQAAGYTLVHGWIVAAKEKKGSGEQEAEKIDEVLVSVFREPKSYTGEDSLEISCHGGSAAYRGVMAALRGAGFRDALHGEFTFRAFINGKLDLTRCESVMEMVSAKTDIASHHAAQRLSGVLENEINGIKQNLVEVLSGTEIFLDYSEDEISVSAEEKAGLFPCRRRTQEILIRLQKLAKSWLRERIFQEGKLAVIAGMPNAGKSSLFNLLLKEERSIVTEIPGTTRDWIEALVAIDGIPVRLADTAGLRESADPVEKIGVERSRDLLEAADIILYLIDGAAGITGEDTAFIKEIRSRKPLLALWNKVDITRPPSSLRLCGSGGMEFEAIPVSAKTGEGISELTAAIAALIAGTVQADTADGVGIGTVRQKNHVETAVAALEEALSLADRGEPLDLIAPLLREAVNALGEITGEVSTADILEEMFGRFCVGK